ncbi:hypothetical protein LTR70_003315 [Exophiala xenobiotica]|uniref:Uncharacterized protein n=1 Tax=Lithohypha guttulata TaxID=1690604 RepID=A0ABR0KLN9_9EURO|nr:hypothetical protein LTR24_001189 [Lithohypha guttulata]KAK5323637.1 hypothetical protein LTR70_003315 [Exophiala xenobiotica]
MAGRAMKQSKPRANGQKDHIRLMGSIREQFEKERLEVDEVLRLYEARARRANMWRDQYTYLGNTQPLKYVYEEGQTMVESLERSADKSVVTATVKYVKDWAHKRMTSLVVDDLSELQHVTPRKQMEAKEKEVYEATVETEEVGRNNIEGFQIQIDHSD